MPSANARTLPRSLAMALLLAAKALLNPAPTSLSSWSLGIIHLAMYAKTVAY